MLHLIILIYFIFLSNSQIVSEICTYLSDPLVRCTTQGLIRGKRLDFSLEKFDSRGKSIESKSIYAFLGIPYGEAPDGERRFRKPIPKEAWTQGVIYNATRMANSCYQMIIDSFNATGEKIWTPLTPLSEDCLYLNIWTPLTAQQQQLLAVMVWIYGGGFASGSVNSLRS